MSETFNIEEGRAYVIVAVEHAQSEIIATHAARSANRYKALEPLRQREWRQCFGPSLVDEHKPPGIDRTPDAPSRAHAAATSGRVTVRRSKAYVTPSCEKMPKRK